MIQSDTGSWNSKMQRCLRLNIKTLVLFVIILAGFFVYLNISSTTKLTKTTEEVVFRGKKKINDGTRYDLYFKSLEKENFTKTLIDIANEIKDKAGMILLAMINDAFVSMTDSWLCNTKPFGIHKHVLFITTDQKSENMIRSAWPNVSAVYIAALDIQGDQEYSKVGYVKMMHLRAQIIRVLIEQGFTLLLFETDCLWIQNPLPDVELHAVDNDLVVVKPTHKNGYLGGFQLLKSTKNTSEFYRAFAFQMWKLFIEISSYDSFKSVPDEKNDQVFFSKLLMDKFKYLKISVLSPEKYIDGKWYIDFSEEKRKKLKPYIINNNWVKGNGAKIDRAKKWGHWFLYDNSTCNEEQVKKIIQL